MSDIVLELRGATRIYNKDKPNALQVLNQADLQIKRGEIVALVGPSGAGKSTFLHLAGLLEKPDGGQVFVGGVECTDMTDKQRTAVRREKLGFVYQFHHLLPEFTALENVAIPQMIDGRSREESVARGQVLLRHLGLGERLEHRPSELSGGEQQRVAIARALANEPDVLLADEPTGNLDPRTSRQVFDNLIQLVRTEHLAAVIATHNLDLARRMDRVVLLGEGKLIDSREVVDERQRQFLDS